MNLSNSSVITINNVIINCDVTWTRTFVSILGVLANSINISVFIHPKLIKETTYKYMLINSINNLVYIFFWLITKLVLDCDLCCTFGVTYSAAVYVIFFIFYLSNCLAVFRISMQVILLFQTYCTLTNRVAKISYKCFVPIAFGFSLILYAQQPFSYSIAKTTTSNGLIVYTPKANQFSNSDIGKLIAIGQTLIRLFLATVVLTILIILNVIEFKKRFNNSVNVGDMGLSAIWRERALSISNARKSKEILE